MQKYEHIVIVGDFNRREIDWETLTSSNAHDLDFIEAVKDSFLTQHVDQPTRGRGSNDPSVIDLVFTLGNHHFDVVEYASPLGNSDHGLLKFK